LFHSHLLTYYILLTHLLTYLLHITGWFQPRLLHHAITREWHVQFPMHPDMSAGTEYSMQPTDRTERKAKRSKAWASGKSVWALLWKCFLSASPLFCLAEVGLSVCGGCVQIDLRGGKDPGAEAHGRLGFATGSLRQLVGCQSGQIA